MRYHWLLVMVVLSLQPVAASSLENEFVLTINAIDHAREDGADVSDLVHRSNNVAAVLDQCGWSACTSDIQQEQILELHDIRDEARSRQETSTWWLVGGLLMIVGIVLYHYRTPIYYHIYWWMIRRRRIDYSEDYDETA